VLNHLYFTALESLALTLQIGWPLQLIFDEKSLQEYQILFRLILYTKHIERLLSKTWKEHQFIRQFPVQSKDRKTDSTRASNNCNGFG